MNRLRYAFAFAFLIAPAMAQQPPTMMRQDDAIVALYQQISDAYALGRRALGICQADAAQQLAELRKENEELKKQLKGQ